MKLGVKLSPQMVEWSALEEAWAAAGQAPEFESVWTFDHLYPLHGEGPCFEGWTTLAALAHHARGKRVGHLVLAATYRHPGLLAKMATVMDHATGGRFVLGLGAGWHEAEARAFDLPLPSIGERMRILESTLTITRSLIQATPPSSATPGARVPGAAVARDDIDAHPYHLRVPRNDPGPWGMGPRIVVGTDGERVGLRLVARLADGWNHSAARDPDPARFVQRLDVLRRHCDTEGRDPATIEVSVQLPVGADPSARRRTVALGQTYRTAGCDLLVLMADPRRGAAAIHETVREVAGELAG